MYNEQEKWERVMTIIKEAVMPRHYKTWLSDLGLLKVDEDLKAVFAVSSNPFKAAYISGEFGETMDKAVQLVFGDEYRTFVTYDKKLRNEEDELVLKMSHMDCDYRVLAMIAVNNNLTDEELVGMKLGDAFELHLEK